MDLRELRKVVECTATTPLAEATSSKAKFLIHSASIR